MIILLHWLFCVLLSTGLVALFIWLHDRDIAWVGRHIPTLCLAVFGLSLYTLYAGSKPPPIPDTPTVKGITLAKPVATPNDVTLTWTRDDGSNHVGHAYTVQKRERSGGWSNVKEVSDEGEATVNGFIINRNTDWRVIEEVEE